MTQNPANAVVFLFSDIEGSTRLWEQYTAPMQSALARHDQIARQAVQQWRGHLVKGTGDGIHAAFHDAGDALRAVLQMQHALAAANAASGLPLQLRCGLHAGSGQARDNDYFGPEVNRAARIMAAAHGGQMLVSQAVADLLAASLPEGVALRDLGAARLKDLSRPERLWQVLAPPLRSEFPALRGLQATPHNLAQPLNRFIGREQVLPQLQALVAQHRLVTLLGTGGIGKSRLSVQLGAALMDRFPDGVWLVELAPVQGGEAAPLRVAQALALVLGLKEVPGQALADGLDNFVRDRHLLLVLDNCEQVLPAAAALAKRLLRASAGLSLVATSREALHVAGEATFAVPALSAPDPAVRHHPAAMLQHEAVRLFVDRASAVQPGFVLDAGNAAAVAEICHRLDGIPLAIELAAARVRALPVATLARRLADSFKLVATTDETVAPRQRTLHHLIDWSHQLLTAPERCLFRRLSVFAGGCTLEAAEAVCADAQLSSQSGLATLWAPPGGRPAGAGLWALSTDDVAELMVQLVDKSLLVLDQASGRYRMLETVRLHAADRLAEAAVTAHADPDERTHLRQRHLAHGLALAEAARPHLGGPGQADWLARLDAERDNLLAAQAHAAQSPGADAGEAGLRLAGALRAYWTNRGLLTLGLAGIDAALAHPEAQAPTLMRARGLFHAGQLCIFLGRHAQACQHLEACLAIVRALGESAPMAAALQPLGTVYAALGRTAQARACFEEAVAAERQLARPHQLAAALVALALWFAQQRQPDAAEPLYLEALAIARAQGDDDAVATTLLNLAMLAIDRGPWRAAVPSLCEALPLIQQAGSQPLTLGLFDLASALAVAAGHAPQAQRWHHAAEAVRQRTGQHREAADAAFLAPWVARLQALPVAAPVPADAAPDALRALADWLRGLAA